MTDWVEAAAGAVAGAIASALGLTWRAARSKERMVADTEKAATDARDAKALADALTPRVSSLEQRGAVHEALIARMEAGLAKIQVTLEDVRDRLPPR